MLTDIKGKQDEMEGLAFLPEARRTLEVTTLYERDKNNKNAVDAVSPVKF